MFSLFLWWVVTFFVIARVFSKLFLFLLAFLFLCAFDFRYHEYKCTLFNYPFFVPLFFFARCVGFAFVISPCAENRIAVGFVAFQFQANYVHNLSFRPSVIHSVA